MHKKNKVGDEHAMPGSVQELTGTLLSAIDAKGNVQDMSIVLNVVATLEKTNVTVEDLKVTRLAKFINLIRHKVDRRLSKRLKNLVKQWKLLLPSIVPNGFVPPASSSVHTTTPTPTTASSLNSARVDGHASPSVQTTHSPSDSLGVSISSSNSIDFSSSQHSSTTLSPNGSTSCLTLSEITPSQGQETNLLSRPTSVDPPSPTPPTSTHSTRPTQPVSSINPTRNRIKMMQKLSSVKKSPSKSHTTTTQHEDVPVIPTQLEGMHAQNSHFRTLTSHSLAEPLTFQSTHPATSSQTGHRVGVASNAVDVADEEEWTSGLFTEMAVMNFTNGSDWAPTSPDEIAHSSRNVTTCNGTVEMGVSSDFNQSFRKRPRSCSPSESEQHLLSAPAHKKHKSHRHSSKRSKHQLQDSHLSDYIVKIPLGAVCLNHRSNICEGLAGKPGNFHVETDLKADVNKVNRNVGPTSGPDELVVSFRRTELIRVPTACVEREENFKQDMLPLGRTKNHHQSCDPSCQSHDHTQRPHFGGLQDRFVQQNEDVAFNNSRGVETEGNDSTASWQRPVPEGVCPGVDGCVGSDGYWYEWTEHIGSQGEEVTVLPYVYLER